MTSLPLAGRRILVTRAVHQASKLSDGLRAVGAEPVEVPVLEIRLPENLERLDAAIRQIDGYDWLVLTSANTVRALTARAAVCNLPLTPSSSLRIAAIGEATARAAREASLVVTLIPESYVAESLAEALGSVVSGQRVLLVRAAIARDVIPDALRVGGATVDVVDAYQNALPEAAPERLRDALAWRIDAVTFTSSSTVTHLKQAAKLAGIAFPFFGISAISIGPVTSQTLRDSGWEPAAEADPSDIAGLIAVTILTLS